MLLKPESNEYNSNFSAYIGIVPEGDYNQFLHDQLHVITSLFTQMSEEQGEYRYEAGKWSVKEVLGHMTDTERVMSYRMLRIARGDTTNLPGFDQDLFMANVSFNELTLEALLADFIAVRQATFTLLTTISEAAWLRKGFTNSHEITARSLAYIIAGHAQHHLNVIEQRYL